MAKKLCARCGFPCQKRELCWYCYKRQQAQTKLDVRDQLNLCLAFKEEMLTVMAQQSLRSKA
jgi:hypothetical protein